MFCFGEAVSLDTKIGLLLWI